MNLGQSGSTSIPRGGVQFLSTNNGIQVSDGTHMFSNRRVISQFYISGNAHEFNLGVGITIEFEATQSGSVKIYNIDPSGTETLLIPNATYGPTDGQNLSASTLYQFPPANARYSFSVAPPRGISALRADFYSSSNQTGTIIDTAYYYYIIG